MQRQRHLRKSEQLLGGLKAAQTGITKKAAQKVRKKHKMALPKGPSRIVFSTESDSVVFHCSVVILKHPQGPGRIAD